MATKQGAFLISGGFKPKSESISDSKTFTVIDNEGYTLKVRKTWVQTANTWHIEFLADIAGQEMTRHEYFLSDIELTILRIAL